MDTAERQRIRDIALKTPAGILAFGFGSGLSPWAPGTMGTLVAWALAPLLLALPLILQVVWVVSAFLFGIKICGVVASRLGVHDHGGIVWDEMAAFWLCVLFIPYQWQWLLAAFVIFRFFDIIKPWPISWADKHVSGGLGVMLDDTLAAVCTIFILVVTEYYLYYSFGFSI